MISKFFDARIITKNKDITSQAGVLLSSGSLTIPVSLLFYSDKKSMTKYSRIQFSSEMDLKWKDEFVIQDIKTKQELGRGIILAPVFEGI